MYRGRKDLLFVVPTLFFDVSQRQWVVLETEFAKKISPQRITQLPHPIERFYTTMMEFLSAALIKDILVSRK